ncbi:hypothetical protein SEA_FORZA_37 [Gordonia phage Forza]|uniref:Uncharacterized protein n=1 Tax=Gordonia phage Forza TaxID=2571247 RepID=A0A650EY97_9CAUD|nr:hypothetical protein PP303_gp037 [Gordonia phage Forza]QGT55030.1 hypothetical protein SEA_FORZA_37 [Gordonia phage Forza]UXE04180.1 hypothetical protein SEA_BLUENGOLD_36 [Gordonia phage BlueNGold]
MFAEMMTLVALILVTLCALILARQQTLVKRTRAELQELRTHVENSQKTVEKQISQIFLTEDERKLLGLPSAVDVTKQLVESGVKEKVERADGLIPACKAHKWSAKRLEKPRRKVGARMRAGDDGMVYVRTCLKCGERQARLYSESKYDWIWNYD